MELFIRHLFVCCNQFCLLLEIIVKTTAVTIQSIEKFLNGGCSIFNLSCSTKKETSPRLVLSLRNHVIYPPAFAGRRFPLRPDVGPFSSIRPAIGFRLLCKRLAAAAVQIVGRRVVAGSSGATVLVIGTMSCSCQTGTRNFLPQFP